MHCIFCLQESEPGNEHVIPEAIGGALRIREVCATCNSNLNKLIDTPFTSLPLIRVARFCHNIGGKRGDVPKPFPGAGDTDSGQKILLSDELKPYLIRYVQKQTGEDGSVEVSISVDATDEHRLDEMLEGPFREILRDKNPNKSDADIEAAVKRLIAQAKQTKSGGSLKPETHYRLTLNVDDLIFEFMKIAYEMGFVVFGHEWVERSEAAAKLRHAILNRDSSVRIHGQIPCEDAWAHLALDPLKHHVLILNNACYVRLFGVPGMVELERKGGHFLRGQEDAEWYEFDFINMRWQKINLLEFVASKSKSRST
jgi:hypothetical protein